jgi:hypothetical protein
MLDEQIRRQFIGEVWRRYEELQNWAIANWPDPDNPLSTSDFVEGRKEILALGQGRMRWRQAAQAGAEPENGGKQYEQVTPMPWP